MSIVSISIHAPHTGRDPQEHLQYTTCAHISIHAPHTGRDFYRLSTHAHPNNFNPRAPYGARRPPGIRFGSSLPDFNPRAPYGARLVPVFAAPVFPDISIHAPHTGRDAMDTGKIQAAYRFQSTRPIRGATPAEQIANTASCLFQSTRPIRGATYAYCMDKLGLKISIHAPHTGRDALRRASTPSACIFQSTRPIRGATPRRRATRATRCNFNPRAPYGARLYVAAGQTGQAGISIHAPHTGRDGGIKGVGPDDRHFNPRAPYGARPCGAGATLIAAVFQSTRPIRGATLSFSRPPWRA